MNSFSVWSCNVLKFMPESSYFSCRTTFYIGIMHDHSFQCVSYTWHIDTGNNMTGWMTAYSSRQV